MELTKIQIKELDSCKDRILKIEQLIKGHQSVIAFNCSLDSTESNKKLRISKNKIDQCRSKIENIISIQAESMKINYDLCLDLIFDREYTLELIKNI